MEFELLTHPSETSFGSKFDRTGKLRRDKGRYSLTLDADNPADVREFESLFLEKNAISIDGHTAKQLAAFDVGFNEPEAKTALEELHQMRGKLPALIEDADTKAAEAEIMRVALDENSDLARVDALFQEQRRKQDEAAKARLMSDTAERRIAALEAQVKNALLNRRKKEAERLKALLWPEVELFNDAVNAAYVRFNDVAQDLLRKINECDHSFPAQVTYRSPAFNVMDGARLKDLTLRPAIRTLPDKLWFELKPAVNTKDVKK